MPKVPDVQEVPNTLKPYLHHGANLTWDSKQAKGTCPFCLADKFRVEVLTGVFRCLVCGTGGDKGGGNSTSFLRLVHEGMRNDEDSLAPVAKERRILSWETLQKWDVGIDAGGIVHVAGRSIATKNVDQVYKWDFPPGGKKRTLKATWGIAHRLLGLQLFDESKPVVYVCEGLWDAMALWESLRSTKEGDQGWEQTSSVIGSLGEHANVLAVPGTNVFDEKWSSILDGKVVVLCYDSDRPREINGKIVQGAGFAAVKRLSSVLTRSEGRPAEVHWIRWGENGYDPDEPDGYDVRDALKDGEDFDSRAVLLQELLGKVSPVPDEWVPGKSSGSRPGEISLESLPCETWEELMGYWRKPMRMTDGLEIALSVMLGSAMSTRQLGDQWWVKIIGPAACGKSTLCEALSVNRKHVVAKSTIRGFHSGFSAGSGGKDCSLIDTLRDKTLVTKDGDTLLQSPNKDQILSEGRDVYDRVSRTHYRNSVSRDYQGINMTWILCGTASLRALDSSELGERFLDCVIMEGIDPELEDEIVARAIDQAEIQAGLESDGSAESQHDPDLMGAMQRTGGYLALLRQNAREWISSVKMSKAAKERVAQLAVFTAHLRARPSKSQEETNERELATRLGKVLTKAAKTLAAVLNRPEVDDEVLRRVGKLAKDTARGRTMEIARWLWKAGRTEGLSPQALSIYTSQGEESEINLLKFLRAIKVVETFSVKKRGVSSRPKFRLTKRIHDLFTNVMGGEDAQGAAAAANATKNARKTAAANN